MDLGVLEGQTRGDYFLNSIFDPSVKQCTVHSVKGHLGYLDDVQIETNHPGSLVAYLQVQGKNKEKQGLTLRVV